MSRLPTLIGKGDGWDSQSATEWNNLVDAVEQWNNLTVSDPLTLTKTRGGAVLGMRRPSVASLAILVFGRFQLKEEKDDHLLCTVPGDPNDTESVIAIAKPPLLQRTPFHGKTRLIDGVEVHYDYVDEGGAVSVNKREAFTVEADPDDEIRERHTIGPVYLSHKGVVDVDSDVIRAARVGAFIVDMVDDDEEDIEWWEIDSQREWRLVNNG